MYNVIINSNCNLRCDYCFADDYMYTPESKSKSQNMSVETFRDILLFLKKSKASHVSILGGEPTLHPDFKEFWMMAKEFNIEFSLKSNALWSNKDLEFFNEHSSELYSFHLNINHPKNLTTNQWQIIRQNTLNLKSKKKRIQLNIDKPEFEYKWLLDLGEESAVTEIYWSLAAPIASEGNPNNTFAAQSSHRKEYKTQLENFISEADLRGFKTFGVHGPTPCLVSHDLYQRIRSNGSFIDGRCLPVFDIFPDKKVHYCFPLKGVLTQPSIDDVDSLEDIAVSFIKETMVLRSISFPWDDCKVCPEALSNNCHGGCLSQKKMIKQKLEDAWNYFDQSIPLLSDKIYFGDNFILFKGKPQLCEPTMFQLLQKVNGVTPLESILSELYPPPINTLEALKQRDAFSTLVAKAVTYEWLFLGPASGFEVQLR